MLVGDDADKLERDLRALIPALVALAYRERVGSKALADRVVKLVMRCARDPDPAPEQVTPSPADDAVTTLCVNPQCDRLVAPGATWCCGSCQLAESVGYEVPDTDSLGHTTKCELRQRVYRPV